MSISTSLTPLIKYPGGKSSEIKIIKKYMPKSFNAYIEPFVGGGAVYFHLNNKTNYINDKSEELMLLYEYVKNNNIVLLTTLPPLGDFRLESFFV